MRRVMIISASVVAVVALVIGAWWWRARSMAADVAPATRSGSISLNTATESPAPQASGAESGGLAVSGASPRPSAQASSGNNSKVKGDMTNNNLSVNSGNNDNNSTQKADDFSQYDQYKTSDKVMYADITTGNGDQAVAGKKLTVNYRGWLTNGNVFDESYSRGQPFSFTLGAHQVIVGWDEGMVGMKIGGKRRLIVPPAAGYGNQAMGPIPAGSVLVFDVELLGVQ